MKEKCKNCGKLKANHYKSIEDKKGGSWCYQIHKVTPGDGKYSMMFDKEVKK